MRYVFVLCCCCSFVVVVVVVVVVVIVIVVIVVAVVAVVVVVVVAVVILSIVVLLLLLILWFVHSIESFIMKVFFMCFQEIFILDGVKRIHMEVGLYVTSVAHPPKQVYQNI